MKMQLLNLRFGNKANKCLGNKAFVFSLDIIVAVVVVVSILAASTFYVAKAGSESVTNLHTVRVGSDVLALLDHDGILDNLSIENIEINLNRVLPINYQMRTLVNCIGGDQIAVETTDIFPQDRFVGNGKRVFVTNTSKYCIADFSIWLK